MTVWIGVLSILWTACSKEASYRTDLQLKPLVQRTSASQVEPLRTMTAYAYASLDTVRWTVASYGDALEGIVTERATGRTRRDGIRALPLLGGGAEGGDTPGDNDGGDNGNDGNSGAGGDSGDAGGDDPDGPDDPVDPDDPTATWLTMRVDASRVLVVVADTETEQ